MRGIALKPVCPDFLYVVDSPRMREVEVRVVDDEVATSRAEEWDE